MDVNSYNGPSRPVVKAKIPITDHEKVRDRESRRPLHATIFKTSLDRFVQIIYFSLYIKWSRLVKNIGNITQELVPHKEYYLAK